MRDRYEQLDRVIRHSAQALKRMRDKLDYHRENPSGISNKMIVRYKAQIAAFERAADYEVVRIRTHIRNIENPPVNRKKRVRQGGDRR